MNYPFYSLTLITHKNNTPIDQYLHFIHQCAIAGITALQLREKQASYQECLELGRQLKPILADFQIPLIVNDNVALAIELDAEGVHLGQTDTCPMRARQQLGDDKIIGLSIDSIQNLHTANELPIDYVGVGAIFPTETKQNVTTIWGLDGLTAMAPLSKHPIVAIGGINESNTEEVMHAGAHGIAVISAIHDAMNLAQTIKSIRQKIGEK